MTESWDFSQGGPALALLELAEAMASPPGCKQRDRGLSTAPATRMGPCWGPNLSLSGTCTAWGQCRAPPGKRGAPPCSCLASATRCGWQQHSPCETETRAAPRELPSGTTLGLLRLTTAQELPLSTATGTERWQSTRRARCPEPCHVLRSRGTHPEHPTWLRHHGSLGRDTERGLLTAWGGLLGLCQAAKPHKIWSCAPQNTPRGRSGAGGEAQQCP